MVFTCLVLSFTVLFTHGCCRQFLPQVLLPEHLYGQLVQHEDGCDLVRVEMPDLAVQLKQVLPDGEPVCSGFDPVKVKAALWALGHIGRTSEGMAILSEFSVIDSVVSLAMDHPLLPVRG